MERVSVAALRPHDLLRVDAAAPHFADAPPWVDTALSRAPFVVVRRAPRLDDAIPVGIRGGTRSERFGSWIMPHRIIDVSTPEKLLTRAPNEARASLPAFALLRAITPLIDATKLDWGPAGSAGFELASGAPTLTPTSDLDIVVRAPTPLSHADAAALFDSLSRAALAAGTRIDVQVETPDAAFSLAEFARANLCVMLRHADGPRLAADPWGAS